MTRRPAVASGSRPAARPPSEAGTRARRALPMIFGGERLLSTRKTGRRPVEFPGPPGDTPVRRRSG
ncbi:hypothetical protein NS228_03210 [Methylobacterium indicum]|nr:hypothetical protein NS229_16480 [Methylobacterium indicum]KTS42168.1 hypothetical protein NS228_03210 [Methylobacterium indicum]KTS45502.1 hypothetical protein NS230_23700 [Methylobacterium indicum]